MTSSPTRPSPRVAARSSLPFWYTRSIARPSTAELAEVSRLFEPSLTEFAYPRWAQWSSSSRLNALSRLISRCRCSTGVKVVDRWRADLLGRRVRRTECRKCVFELVELSHDGVELAVGDGRRIEYVASATARRSPAR